MGTRATTAATHATATIPIVFGLVGDAVGVGVVPNLARPGGNVTGMALFGPEVFGKGLELLKEAVPRAERVMITRPLLDNLKSNPRRSDRGHRGENPRYTASSSRRP